MTSRNEWWKKAVRVIMLDPLRCGVVAAIFIIIVSFSFLAASQHGSGYHNSLGSRKDRV